MTDSNTIRVRDLVVEHSTLSGSLRVLDCPELTLAGGMSTAVVGPSGSGKSTFLGVLGGLLLPATGSVTIGSTDLVALSESERVAFRKDRIGLVYQADNLLPFLTVAENIHLQLALCADTEDTQRRIAELLDRLGMGSLADRLPDQLSGGQRQRVAIARAVVHQPSVILADEPTGSLDEENATAVIQLLRELHRLLGSTLVIVTHDPAVANSMDRLVEIQAGSFVNLP